MSRAKAPPRIKGPYSKRGGTRFRIRICDAAGRRICTSNAKGGIERYQGGRTPAPSDI